ncbi:transcriptional activator xlnR [Purpureocillium lavendulum]|uniref:Transcriptional activator xlnR n=1 Tax=Purpureocillium lavendulum TaxID=1247861 RepID=A0AB34FC82_9HYPO|nr:transcriptional activator xlnR [Purpureocillium lavendulum]
MAESASTATPDTASLLAEEQQPGPTDTACYKFLWPVLPYTRNIISSSVASELLNVFLTEPGSSLFGGASPARVVDGLYKLTTSLVSERDPDRWRRTHGGLRVENGHSSPSDTAPKAYPDITPANEPVGDIDDVLAYILLSIAISGSDFKSDCYKWWSKAVRLAITLRLNREDDPCSATLAPCANPGCVERQEERRRVFWLLYSLDRHLSLSFNTVLSIPDSYCEVYDLVWENLDTIAPTEMPARTLGPPVLATGSSFFEFFLPLMAILGDIIEVHHRRRHPRLGAQEDSLSVEAIQNLLDSYELSLNTVTHSPGTIMGRSPSRTQRCSSPGSPVHAEDVCASPDTAGDPSRARLVIAYSTHILHVLHVLLYGKWDAIAMLEDDDDWITSKRFTQCTSHAIAASQSLSTILAIDPELAFMSYLFGIYLLQGSFIFLLFADRLPQLGPNESVQQACENIIRAHEVCVVTLSTEFQVRRVTG